MTVVDESRYGYVYRTINLLNSKTYIGRHKTRPGEKWNDYFGSGRVIAYAVRKYGKNSFKKELLLYADSEIELNEMESELIKAEILLGKGEYNIALTGDYSRKAVVDLEKYPILDWYFEDKMSMRQIADKVGCSYNVIAIFFRDNKENDERIQKIVPRQAMRKILKTKESIDKTAEAVRNLPKIKCSYCAQQISQNAFRKHEDSCKTFPRCKKCSTKLSKRNAIFCRKHSENKDDMSKARSKTTVDMARKGGLKTAHIRWHEKRKIKNKNCEFCL